MKIRHVRCLFDNIYSPKFTSNGFHLSVIHSPCLHVINLFMIINNTRKSQVGALTVTPRKKQSLSNMLKGCFYQNSKNLTVPQNTLLAPWIFITQNVKNQRERKLKHFRIKVVQCRKHQSRTVCFILSL